MADFDPMQPVNGSPLVPAATVSPQDIAEMRARVNAATEGPWAYRTHEIDDWGVIRTTATKSRRVVATARAGGSSGLDPHRQAGDDPCRSNGEFIAHARSDMPRLLDAIEALTAENARLRKQVEYEQRCGAEYVASLADVRAENAQLASERDTLRDAVAEGWSIIGGLRAEVEAAHAAAKSDALWHGPMTDVVADIRPALTAQPGESPLADPEYPELVRMARESSKDGD